MEPKIYYRLTNENGQIIVDYIDPNGVITSQSTRNNFNETFFDTSQIITQRADNMIKSILINEAKRLSEKQKKDYKFDNIQLSRVDLKTLKKYNNKVYDPNYQLLMEQIVDTIIAAPLQQERTVSEKIRMWLKHVSTLGKGSFGVANTAGINKIDNLLVFKYNFKQKLGITHEYVIGMYLNKLRIEEKAMNFVYTYGAFSCAESPLVDPRNIDFRKKGSKNPLIPSFCHDNGNLIDHLLIENIAGSLHFSKFIRRADVDLDKFLRVFMSIFMALGVANHEFGFTHWDCHGDNILVTNNNNFTNHHSVYKIGVNNVYYVKTNGLIPYIIDYGQASIRLESGAYLGPQSEIAFPEYRGEPFFLQDIYKIIISTLFDCKRNSRTYIFALKCLEGLFGLQPIEIFTINAILSKNSPRTVKDTEETLWRRIPPIASTANDFDRALKIITKIISDLNFDINTILIINPDEEPQNLLACRSSGCLVNITRKPPNTYDTYLDLCYSGVKLDEIENKNQKDLILTGLDNDLVDIKDQITFLQKSVQIAKKMIELVKNPKWNGKIVDQVLIDYSGGGNISVLIVKLYDQFITWWSLLEEFEDISRISDCIELEKIDPDKYENIMEFIQIKVKFYTEEVVPLSKTLKDSIILRGQLINSIDKMFTINWNLYQYIIEQPL